MLYQKTLRVLDAVQLTLSLFTACHLLLYHRIMWNRLVESVSTLSQVCPAEQRIQNPAKASSHKDKLPPCKSQVQVSLHVCESMPLCVHHVGCCYRQELLAACRSCGCRYGTFRMYGYRPHLLLNCRMHVNQSDSVLVHCKTQCFCHLRLLHTKSHCKLAALLSGAFRRILLPSLLMNCESSFVQSMGC